MQVKVGDLIQNRYVLKQIMLNPSKNFKEHVFFLFDKEKQTVVDFTEKEMLKLLNKGGEK